MEMEESADLLEVWGFVLGFVFSIFGVLGVAKLTDGDTRRLMLQSAFAGAVSSLVLIAMVAVFVAQY
jgi:hypothetical protein